MDDRQLAFISKPIGTKNKHLKLLGQFAMYDLQYVRKRRRRRIASLVALISSIGVACLVVTSFLGRTVGTFTVAVTNTTVKLALSKKADLSDATSYLRVDKLYPLRETSFENLPSHDLLDDEQQDYDYGFVYNDDGDPDSMSFIKYTFYVTNLSSTIAKYNLTIKLGDRNESIDGTKRGLDDTLRVMVYENDPATNSHDYTVYAKEAAEVNYDSEGNKTRREFISTYPSGTNKEDDEHKLAETFLPGQSIVKYTASNFKKGDIKRYTLVIWLEGEDPQSDNSKEIPEGASLKLGVDIAAYEND